MVRKMIVGMGEAMGEPEGGEEGLRVLTSVLQKVRDRGDLEEEDDGYFRSSDDEGPVTGEMAARGVGEAGCVVVADSIWNKLVPRDLLKVFEKTKRERRSRATDRASAGRRGPVDSMLQSLRVDTGGLHLTSALPNARILLTYKNKLKCRAILDTGQVNSSDPRRPPKFRLPALEGIRRWMGDAKRNRAGGGGGGAECSLLSSIYRMCIGASGSPPCGGKSLWWRVVQAEGSDMPDCRSDGATALPSANGLSRRLCGGCFPGGEFGVGCI